MSGAEDTLPPVPSRRAEDPRISRLVTDFSQMAQQHEAMKKSLDENTIVTNQVRDIIVSMKLLATVAKWLSIVAGAGSAIVGLWHKFKYGG